MPLSLIRGQGTRRTSNVRYPAALHQCPLYRAPLPATLGNERVDFWHYFRDGLDIQRSVLPEESGFSVANHHERGGSEGIQIFENCMSGLRQGRLGLVHILQSQRTLRLVAVRVRSGIPKPPNRSRQHTLDQLTWQWPPLASFFPAHRKLRRILLTCFNAFLLKLSTMSWCNGITASTNLTSAKRLARGIIDAFQVGSLSANRSTTGWNASPGSRQTERGMPRYLMEGCQLALHHHRRVIRHLLRAGNRRDRTVGEVGMQAPVACPKSSRMARMACSSVSSGWQKMTTSSAYSDTDVSNSRRAKRLRIPNSIALTNTRLSVFMISTNSDGDRGSPCLRPLLC
ncbi:hypothetical protein QYE76_043263 [Lolium multiflorum]|uniref:Uncharacterized protein n=1 Tax=Lolium multiflorum TaxID=4521 RepID=A0AAD8TGA4_LOLMU|nr:hypothetical protein QYE76_043263 [Lolium multiflorum]